MKDVRYIAVALAALIPGILCADDFVVPDLQTQVSISTLIARVEITTISELHDRTGNTCGFVYEAKILERIKGDSKAEISFYSFVKNDTLPIEHQYLLMAGTTTPEYEFKRVSCTSDEKFSYFTRDEYQTLFPLELDSRTGKPVSILVDRRSPFAPGNFVSQGNLISYFSFASNNRLFAFVDYEKAIDQIKAYK